MKQLFTMIIFLAGTINSRGQETDSTEARLESWLVKGHFIPLSVNFEGRIGDSFSIDVGTGISAGGAIENDGHFRYLVYPNVSLQFRNYYNLQKRMKKGKRTAMNSGNYWGIFSKMAFAPIAGNIDSDYKWGIVVAPMWGFQRSYSSQITWGFNLGYGVNVDNENTRLTPILNLRLGFVLAK